MVNDTRGILLYSKDADKRIHPASTTKILTALIIANAVQDGRYSLDDTFPAYADLYYDVPWDGSNANIQPGEVMTVRDYLYCTLLSSANEACNALAVFHSGSIESFVKEMNDLALSLGCTDTYFVNPHGITNENHLTTALDMYRIFSAAIKNPVFRSICSSLRYTVPSTNMNEARKLVNSNRLINSGTRYYYEYAVMGKTGYTKAAGNCLVSAAEKDGETLICVIMGARDSKDEQNASIVESFTESRALYEWCYREYGDQKLLKKGQIVGTLPVKYGKDADSVSASVEQDVTVYMKASDAENNVEYTVIYDSDELIAPVKAGDEVGVMTVKFGGEVIGISNLLSSDSVSLSYIDYFIGMFREDMTTRITVCAMALAFAVLVISIVSTGIRSHASSKRSASGRRK